MAARTASRRRAPTPLRPAAREFAAGPGIPWLASIALGAALFAVYLALAPSVPGDKDASEFALVLASGGVLHPTGYPVYTLLGHAFVRLLRAMGAVPVWAANAWAALGGGVAIALLHRLGLVLLPPGTHLGRGARFTLAAVPVLLFGCNPVWLVECTVVEVHSWQLAWCFGLALTLVRLLVAIEDRTPRLGWPMLAWGLLCGLGGAHHGTSVFFAGALTVALAWALARARRFAGWIPLAWLAGGVVPMLSYAFLYWRAAHPDGAEVWPVLEPTLRGVLDHVRATEYRPYLGRFAPDGGQAAWLAWYIQPYLWPGLLLLAALALRARGFARRLVLGALLAAALAQTLFAFRYGVGDPDAYFLPPLAMALLAIAPLGAGLVAALAKRPATRLAVIAAAAALLAAFVIPCLRVGWGRKGALAEMDRSIHALWASIPYERGIVLWPDDGYYRLKLYQRFLGEKRQLEILNTGSLVHPVPRERFRRRWGFDPVAALTEARRLEPLKPEFAIGPPRAEGDRHAFAVMNEEIALRAGVPVIGFDYPQPPRVWSPGAPRGR